MLEHGSWLCCAFLLTSALSAAEAPTDKAVNALAKSQTRIFVEDMHCADCAKKVARKLYAVKGVKGVRAVLKSHTATVTPEKGKQPSPRALWQAVEEAGFKPIKMVGPSGKFEAKPKK